MSAARAGIPIVVAAPSGAGKTSVCRGLVDLDDGIEFSVSHTTRSPRKGERPGVHYHFVDASEFDRMVAADKFLEWAEYNGNRYGTSWDAIEGLLASGTDVLLEIEVQGARQVRGRLPAARLAFLVPPSMDVLEERLRGRGTDSDEQIEKRLAIARTELAAVGEFDYALENDVLERCVADLGAIVAATFPLLQGDKLTITRIGGGDLNKD